MTGNVGTARVAAAGVVGTLALYALFVAGESALAGEPARPDGSLFGVVGAYAFAVGGWCGWTGRSQDSTVAVAVGVVAALAATALVGVVVPSLAPARDPHVAFLAVFAAMALGYAQALSLAGHWLARTTARRVSR